jgi:CheY-like chemotaxis protein
MSTDPSDAPEADDRLDGFPALSILLADDHDGVRATTAAMLEDLGHAVTEASGGAEVLAIIERSPEAHQLIITDYAMPSLSGVEVIRRARTLIAGLPGIIITGYADTDSIANRPSDVLVLAKPFTQDQLNKTIHMVYGKRAAPAADAPPAAATA